MSVTGKSAQTYDALMLRVAALAVDLSLPVAYPDVPFDPDESAPEGKYIEAKFLPNAPAWQGVSAGALTQGLLQVDVVWPRGLGFVPVLEVVQRVKTWFPKGLAMVSGTTKVKISGEPVEAAPLLEAHQTRTPVTIRWTA